MFRKAASWVLRAGVFVLPLAYTWDTYDSYVLPKLLLARCLVLALAALIGVRAVASGRLQVRRTALDLPLAAFATSAALSSMFAYNQNVAIFGTYSRYDGLLTTLTYTAVFWLAVQVIETREEARAVLRALMAGAYVAAVIAIGQFARDSLEQGTFVAAYGTMGQKNVLGAFLAMTLPLAIYELAQAKSWAATLLSANLAVVVVIALILTFSRSSWIAAVIATVALGGWSVRDGLSGPAVGRLGIAAVIALSATALILGGVAQATRASSLRADFASAGDRPTVWADSVKLIASRPLIGYGPDNFGLVFPRFQSEPLQQPWDKAHAEVLQIAATQGVIGVAAYAAMLAGFVIAFWRGRSNPGAAALFAGVLAYQAVLQVNFTALASAFPYWIFAACALQTWGQSSASRVIAVRDRMRFAPLVGASAAAAAAAAVLGVAFPYLADRTLLSAVEADYAGHAGTAAPSAAAANALNPHDSVYAVEVGNIAFERGDWRAAATAYGEAASLGTYNPMVYRNLAMADIHLGLFNQAHAAAAAAFQLDRFDPANRALLAQFESLAV